MLSRRSVLGWSAASLGCGVWWGGPAAAVDASASDAARTAWQAWRAAHLDPSGRVIDNVQNRISHSEGQGYAMVLATAFEDREAFDAIWSWTQARLQVRDGDALLAWKWDPAQPEVPPDKNNASDGDLFVAWGLLRAAQVFDDDGYLLCAQPIARDLQQICVKPMPGRPNWAVLLPGAVGFWDPGTERATLNLSYAFHRAMRDLAQEFDLPRLALASATNRAITDRMSEFGLPPDWLDVWPSGMAPTKASWPVFGYEAMRIPLFETWSGRSAAPAVRRAAILYADDIDTGMAETGTPTRASLSGSDILERSSDPGYSALRAISLCSYGAPAGPDGPDYLRTPFVAEQNYYPATLHMLAMAANLEVGLQCTRA